MAFARLVLVLHNHQPVGNFDAVFEAAYRESYEPFLDVLADYPDLPIVLHTSGSLMDWLVRHRAEYIDRLRQLVASGQIEVLGGPFYEPILASIPSRDRIGQIKSYGRFLEQHLGTDVRGMWMPERVWEQNFTSDLVDAGIEYTLLDDYHFRAAGVHDNEMHGYYLTEDEDRLLKIFPGSEPLRYRIPFQETDTVFEYLREIAEKHPDPTCVFGDDGEKFGSWPGTYKHVFTDGWLRRFFDQLMENRDWLKVTTLAETVENTVPLGRVYLPDASYREMTEWALPTDKQLLLERLVEEKEHEENWDDVRAFLRGGYWRNFVVKYPEANEMYCRMREVSARADRLRRSTEGNGHPERMAQAIDQLYRGQCNCSYWHGAFGGLYLPHLRGAIYHHLLTADNILHEIEFGRTSRVDVAAEDFNMDGRKEVKLSTQRLRAYLSPAKGGHLYELDVRQTAVNLLATLNRRPEPYHTAIIRAAQQGPGGGDAEEVEKALRLKQPDLDRKIGYDNWPRKSLVDHFVHPGLTLEQFQTGEGLIGDFAAGVYVSKMRRTDERVELQMSRDGYAADAAVRVIKTVSIDREAPGMLEIRYDLESLPPGRQMHFAVEFNVAGMAAGAENRYFYNAEGGKLGPLETVQAVEPTSRVGLVDEWLGVDLSLDLSIPTGWWTFPIQTVSQSEGGFELVHQSSTVVPHWDFHVPDDGRWSVEIRLSVDTSAAQARVLAEPLSRAAT